MKTKTHSALGWGWMALGFAVALAWLSPAFAQLPGLETAPEESTEIAVDPDPYDRGTPRAMATALIGALGADDFTLSSFYLAVPEGNDAEASALLSKRLLAALDDGGSLAPFAMLSNQPQGRVDDGLDPNLEQVGAFKAGEMSVPIIIARQDSDTGPIWQISADTLAALPELPEAEAANSAARAEPALLDTKVAGAPVLDWFKLLGLAIGLYLAFWATFWLIVAAIRRFNDDPEHSPVYKLVDAAAAPLSLYLAVVFFFQIAQQLDVAIVARQSLTRYAGIFGWVALAWFMWRLINGITQVFARRMQRSGKARARSLIVFLRRTLKALLIAVAGIAIFDTLGVDVTTGIAALGIGGLALALGAQKTIENLVGSLTVIVDEPVAVGDFCEVGNVKGTVVDIGMRSTRIRTNERTIVAIPNGNFASEQIENYSKRDSFLFHQTLGVSYDTDAEMMEMVLDSIREIVAADENIIDDDARVRFHGFGDSSLDIEIFAYFRTDNYPASLAMQEKLLFAIMRKLDALKVDIAFPTRTVHINAPPQKSVA